MGDGTELEIGAQSRAAVQVAQLAEPLKQTLTSLGQGFEGAADGFKGASAAALAEAVTEWFTAAKDLIPTIGDYAQKLKAVDTTEAASDSRAVDRMSNIATRMGGPR